jgi:hypothetical protein
MWRGRRRDGPTLAGWVLAAPGVGWGRLLCAELLTVPGPSAMLGAITSALVNEWEVRQT